MGEKDGKLIIITILMCVLAVVMTLIVVLWPREKFEVLVKNHSSSAQSETLRTTLSPMMTININTADVDDLMVLPGMTRKIAFNIVQYRFDYREFLVAEEIINVDGVTWELYAAWSTYIFV